VPFCVLPYSPGEMMPSTVMLFARAAVSLTDTITTPIIRSN
jgi:hypothetical protein